MSHLIEQLVMQTAWDIASAGGDVLVVHPKGCGKSKFQENFKEYLDQTKRVKAQKNYLNLAQKPKPKPQSIRMLRHRAKA